MWTSLGSRRAPILRLLVTELSKHSQAALRQPADAPKLPQMWADGLGGDKGTGSLVPCPSMPTSPPSRRAPLPLPSVKLMLKAPHVHGYWLWPSWNARRCVCVYEYVFTGVPRVHSALRVAWRDWMLDVLFCANLRMYSVFTYTVGTRDPPDGPIWPRSNHEFGWHPGSDDDTCPLAAPRIAPLPTHLILL